MQMTAVGEGCVDTGAFVEGNAHTRQEEVLPGLFCCHFRIGCPSTEHSLVLLLLSLKNYHFIFIEIHS